MALAFDISVLGSAEIERKLGNLAVKVQRKVMRKAMRKAAKPILETAKSLVPVDEGKLRRSLKIRALKRRRGSFGVQVKTGTRDELGIAPDDPYYYPMAVETGTNKVAARPYLRPALKLNRTESLNILARELKAGIAREARTG